MVRRARDKRLITVPIGTLEHVGRFAIGQALDGDQQYHDPLRVRQGVDRREDLAMQQVDLGIDPREDRRWFRSMRHSTPCWRDYEIRRDRTSVIQSECTIENIQLSAEVSA